MTPVGSIFAPFSDVALLILRVFLGVIFFVHGWLKANLRGIVGGAAGWAKVLGQMGMPGPVAALLAYSHAWGETIGGILLILGLLTRVWAVLFGIIMLLAIFGAKMSRGVPFMAGQNQGTGWEFDSINFAVCLALLVFGPGNLSLDRLLGLPL